MIPSIGLGGDGDEIDAIERVEERFGIAFDIEDCERFVTVGDVWRSLQKELGIDDVQAASMWPDFVDALGEETLAAGEAAMVGHDTLLIG